MKVQTLKKVVLLFLLGGLLFLISSVGDTMAGSWVNNTFGGLDRYLWLFFFLVAIVEELPIYVVGRNFTVWSLIGLVVVLSSMEAILYAINLETFALMFRLSIGTVWGVWFWWVMLMRFIYNGHIVFLLAALMASRMTNRFLPAMRKTGRTINVFGFGIALSAHYLWNMTGSIESLDWWFNILALVLSVAGIASLYVLGELKRLKIAV